MDNTLLTIFIAVTAAAVVLQLAILIGMYLALRKTSAKVESLAEEVPDDIILVSESGIKTVEDARRLAEAGADALLVGETLMRHPRPLEFARALMDAKSMLEA